MHSPSSLPTKLHIPKTSQNTTTTTHLLNGNEYPPLHRCLLYLPPLGFHWLAMLHSLVHPQYQLRDLHRTFLARKGPHFPGHPELHTRLEGVRDASPTQTYSFLPASWAGDTHEETNILSISDQEEMGQASTRPSY